MCQGGCPRVAALGGGRRHPLPLGKHYWIYYTIFCFFCQLEWDDFSLCFCSSRGQSSLTALHICLLL